MFRQAGNHCQHLVAASLSLDTDFPSIGKFWLCCLDFHQLSFKRKAKKKKLLFPEMQVTRKIFTRAATNFALLVFLLVLFLLVCFLKLKIYILIHIQLCRWVSDFTGSISGNNTTFFGWKEDVQFHRKTNDYADAYWDSLFDNLRDVAWEDIFKVGAIAAAATEFCELVVDV